MQVPGEILRVLDWGLLDYEESLARQNELAAERLTGLSPDTLILVEHPPVVTLGRRGDKTDLRLPVESFPGRGVALHCTGRGGQATAHEPGQLVVYPIIELKEKDLHLYVRRLLDTVATVLRQYGLKPEFKAGEPGVWVNGEKIASIGIAAKKWVTSHGIALNVNNDLSTFSLIVPCGQPRERMTSMTQLLGRSLDLDVVKDQFVANFREIFSYSASPMEEVRRHSDWLRFPSPNIISAASSTVSWPS